eukprot:311238-Karenia_brevis.AAC.1
MMMMLLTMMMTMMMMMMMMMTPQSDRKMIVTSCKFRGRCPLRGSHQFPGNMRRARARAPTQVVAAP